MKNVMGIIDLKENEAELRAITRHRTLAAVPFAGRYRIIDFILSSMVNSGIENIGVLAQNKYRSIMDHLKSGKEWDLARKREGLFILPSRGNGSEELYRDDVGRLFSNLDYIVRSQQKYILITGSNGICNIDYRKVFKYHQHVQADITMLYKEGQEGFGTATKQTVFTCDEHNRITQIVSKSNHAAGEKVSMNMYIMEKNLLIDIINECCVAGDLDLVTECIAKKASKLKIYGYRHNGYFAQINSLLSYYHHNMALLKPENWKQLFVDSGLIYTKTKDEGPAKYKETAMVSNSIVASGCIIEGRVENSILFRGVKVYEGAYIKDSIIMERCAVNRNAYLEKVICDKNALITAGKRLRGSLENPTVIEKGALV